MSEGLADVLIPHHLAVVEHMATTVAMMYLGRIVEQAGTEELLTDARRPYTRALLQSVLTPEPGLGVPDSQLGLMFPNPVDPPSGRTFDPRCTKAMPVCSSRAITSGSSMVECHLHDERAQQAAE